MDENHYTIAEYEKVRKTSDEVIGKIIKYKKDGESLRPDQLKEKLGSKRDMAELIIALCNACTGATIFMKRIHEHNFDLRGKLLILLRAH